MNKTLLALTAAALSTAAVVAVPAVSAEPLDAATLDTIKSQFGRLMELANKHDFKAHRERLEGRFRNYPAGAADTRREGLGASGTCQA